MKSLREYHPTVQVIAIIMTMMAVFAIMEAIAPGLEGFWKTGVIAGLVLAFIDQVWWKKRFKRAG